MEMIFLCAYACANQCQGSTR